MWNTPFCVAASDKSAKAGAIINNQLPLAVDKLVFLCLVWIRARDHSNSHEQRKNVPEKDAHVLSYLSNQQ